MVPSEDSLSLIEVQKKLEHYCAYQERCHKEVTQKLRDLGVYGNKTAKIGYKLSMCKVQNTILNSVFNYCNLNVIGIE